MQFAAAQNLGCQQPATLRECAGNPSKYLGIGLPEAVTVGASAALVQGLLNRQTRSRRWHLVLGVGVAASAIASADFIYRSLIPNSVQSPTLRLLPRAEFLSR